jgi:hypothetical protein
MSLLKMGHLKSISLTALSWLGVCHQIESRKTLFSQGNVNFS